MCTGEMTWLGSQGGSEALERHGFSGLDMCALIARGKAEILEDVASGRVPRDVPAFSVLHDFVDANEYGGICDDEVVGGLSDVAFMAVGNVVQNALDLWIQGGGIRG